MRLKCERCSFEFILSKYNYHYFFVVCFETPYCPKCGKFIDEDLEEEEY